MSSPKNSPDRLAARILAGLVAGILVGLLARGLVWARPELGTLIQWLADQICDPLGQVFLRLLFFVVVPLVFASLALGIVQLGRLGKLGPLAGRTFAMFALNMAIGVALGLLMMNVLKPGVGLDPGLREQMMGQFGQQTEQLKAAANAHESFNLMTLVRMFMPRNLLKSVTEFEILPLILFALIFGAAGTLIAEEKRRSLRAGLEIICDVMTEIVHFALRLAPYAVPAMIFSVVVKFGAAFLQSLLLFVVGVLAVMAVHLFGTLSILVRVLGRRSPRIFFRAIRTVMVTAFSTSSSSATLPTSIQVSRENLGVSASTAGFVLPLGATMNMSGTALYEGCVVLFIAQVFGVDLTIVQQLSLLMLAVLSAVAVAGIPGGSLPLIIGLLVHFGIPAEGIALILGVDRLLDMARTVVNVSADLATACIVDETSPAQAG